MKLGSSLFPLIISDLDFLGKGESRMDFTVSDRLYTVCINDSGITLTWQKFVPWEGHCSIMDALKVMRNSRIATTANLDANNVLAIVSGSGSADGHAVVISDKKGTTEAQFVSLDRTAYHVLFETLDNYNYGPVEKEHLKNLYETFGEQEDEK